MSERILKALMQLFAIVAEVDGLTNKSRHIVQIFLKQQLNQELVDEYLTLYDEFLEVHHKISSKKEGKKKRTSLNSVKVLKICTQINAELAQKQKVVVLIRILEYINSDHNISEQEMEFATTVADTFNIPKEEFDNCMVFVTCNEDSIPDNSNVLIADNQESYLSEAKNKHIYSEALEGHLAILDIESVNMFALRYFGSSELYLNGQIISPLQTYILIQGSSIRSSKVKPIYYSDIIARFLSDESTTKIIFSVDAAEYKFPNGAKGLHNLTFSEESGKIIAIMGGSGAGKSTLLNVLNGNNPPSQGAVTINGVDIHREKDKIEGVIGYVSQDDLLIEELTVFQNLFYNAKLCFDSYSDEQLTKMVIDLLNSLGLEETKDLKVGNPLEKTISGGQRKRVNIGLELIREPAVLFADEPTSGLSSRDSENIMDLLKELALKGKVVFVVIHQPSSEIFKVFDKLIILDVGGYPIYYGNPVDGVVYFKTMINHVNANESECVECGNVNPEQIFNIIESKVVDEYGNLTDNRKVLPKEWNEYYKEKLEIKLDGKGDENNIPQSDFSIPNKLNQFKVFLVRDVLSKLTNKQYLSINLIETPLLGFVIAYFIKFYDSDIKNELGYIYHDNDNIPVYMFMSVIIALFIGMTVSAEEIIRDQRIRKRESFLNLSYGSYLTSKTVIMFLVSAIQTICFILVGNLILGIKGMYFDYWLVLFSTACFGNMLGLNISATFNSAVTIYILIPILLIPQMMFSGVFVKFDKLNPTVTSQTVVPFVGDAMALRWAYEALTVNQFKNNEYEKHFYELKKEMSIASFKKNFWIPELKAKIGSIENNLKKPEKKEQVASDLALLKYELEKQGIKADFFRFEGSGKLTADAITPDVLKKAKAHMSKVNSYYVHSYNDASDKKDVVVRRMNKDEAAKKAFNELKNNYENLALSDFVTNKQDLKFILEVDGQLIQRTNPIYLDPEGFRAHFYAPRKKLFGNYIDTFWANVGVLWIMSIILMVTLYFDVFKKVLFGLERMFSKFPK
ncbi:ATP-binding cassette domain-containing protein [Bacteroidales bacterium AH-315-I05]|nr:ATP-binding cassette domain-containing protein [Bacteroidales bacterium AH-315-I05]